MPQNILTDCEKHFPIKTFTSLWLVITQDVNFGKLNRNELKGVASFQTESVSNLKRLQQKETVARYQFINETLKETLHIDTANAKDLRSRLDRIINPQSLGLRYFLRNSFA